MAWVLFGIMVDPIKVSTRIFFGNIVSMRMFSPFLCIFNTFDDVTWTHMTSSMRIENFNHKTHLRKKAAVIKLFYIHAIYYHFY